MYHILRIYKRRQIIKHPLQPQFDKFIKFPQTQQPTKCHVLLRESGADLQPPQNPH